MEYVLTYQGVRTVQLLVKNPTTTSLCVGQMEMYTRPSVTCMNALVARSKLLIFYQRIKGKGMWDSQENVEIPTKKFLNSHKRVIYKRAKSYTC